MSEPHNHHYIPQFWLKRFSHDGRSKLVWSYDWDCDTIEKRSVKKLMSEYDLYTQNTSAGDDVTLETGEMGVVDRSGAALFQRLDQGERSSALREELADFLGVMALRHPVTVNRFPLAAAAFVADLQSAFASANSLADLDTYFVSLSLPTSGMTSADFDILKAASASDLDAAFTSIFDKLFAQRGSEDIRYADTIIDRSGRGTLKKCLMEKEWTLGTSPHPDVVIGDIGILLERGDCRQGWKIAIGPSHVLTINNTNRPVPTTIGSTVLKTWQIQAMNLETAAKSRFRGQRVSTGVLTRD